MNASSSELRGKVEALIRVNLSDDYARRSGGVLNSQWETLQEGPLYVMGLNPGGDPQQHPGVIESLSYDIGGYKDDCWYADYCGLNMQELASLAPCPKGVDCKRGKARHQENVRRLLTALRQDVCHIFATNAVFVRSQSGPKLPDLPELWEKCWPVHQFFLSVVKPKIILCLGNGRHRSSFSLLHGKFEGQCRANLWGRAFRQGRLFQGNVLVGQEPTWEPLQCAVVGVPHPSRFDPSPLLLRWLDEVWQKIMG